MTPLEYVLEWYDDQPPILREQLALFVPLAFPDNWIVPEEVDRGDDEGFRAALASRARVFPDAYGIALAVTAALDQIMLQYGSREHWQEKRDYNAKAAAHFREKGDDSLAALLSKDSALTEAHWSRSAASWEAIRAKDAPLDARVMRAWYELAHHEAAIRGRANVADRVDQLVEELRKR